MYSLWVKAFKWYEKEFPQNEALSLKIPPSPAIIFVNSSIMNVEIVICIIIRDFAEASFISFHFERNFVWNQDILWPFAKVSFILNKSSLKFLSECE